MGDSLEQPAQPMSSAARLVDVAPFKQRGKGGSTIVSLDHNNTIGDAMRVCSYLACMQEVVVPQKVPALLRRPLLLKQL
jgi:hypothetical protein